MYQLRRSDGPAERARCLTDQPRPERAAQRQPDDEQAEAEVPAVCREHHAGEDPAEPIAHQRRPLPSGRPTARPASSSPRAAASRSSTAGSSRCSTPTGEQTARTSRPCIKAHPRAPTPPPSARPRAGRASATARRSPPATASAGNQPGARRRRRARASTAPGMSPVHPSHRHQHEHRQRALGHRRTNPRGRLSRRLACHISVNARMRVRSASCASPADRRPASVPEANSTAARFQPSRGHRRMHHVHR